ncbi:Serine/arginine-rich splicing factor 3, partial [Trichinella patagoniensis]
LILLVYFICIAYVMSYREQCPADCKVYVGGLPERASRGELEEIFGRFGPLRNVWVARRPWGFAFVEFEDARDAIDAVRQLDGSRMCGVRARVELSHGQRRNRGPRGYDDERRDFTLLHRSYRDSGPCIQLAAIWSVQSSASRRFHPLSQLLSSYYTAPNCNEKLQSVKMRGRVSCASVRNISCNNGYILFARYNCYAFSTAVLSATSVFQHTSSRLIAAVLAFGSSLTLPHVPNAHISTARAISCLLVERLQGEVVLVHIDVHVHHLESDIGKVNFVINQR